MNILILCFSEENTDLTELLLPNLSCLNFNPRHSKALFNQDALSITNLGLFSQYSRTSLIKDLATNQFLVV